MRHACAIGFSVLAVLAAVLVLGPGSLPLVSAQGDQWEELFPTPAPAPRYGHTMVAIGANIFLFVGMALTGTLTASPLGQAPQNDLWAFDRADISWIKLNSTNTPSARFSHTATAWGGRMYMFGGVDSSNQVLGELWTFEPVASEWQKMAGGPPARKLHASVVIDLSGDLNDRLLIMGGQDQNNNPLNDVWVYDPFTDSWTQKANYPYGNDLYGSSLAAQGDQVSVLNQGGTQMAVYDLGDNSWNKVAVSNAPPARRGAGYTQFANKAWIIGGQDVSTGNALNDTWEYNFETGSWEKVADMPMPLIQLVATYLYISPVLSTKAQRALEDSWILVFGGLDNDHQPVGRTFKYLPAGPTVVTLGSFSARPAGGTAYTGLLLAALLTLSGGLAWVWRSRRSLQGRGCNK